VLGRDHPVEEAARVEVLRGLHALGKRLAGELLVDPRAEEAEQRARLGEGHLPE